MTSYIPAYLKNKNRGLVLELFLEHRELSRADITKLSKISFPTVIKIVDFLLAKRIIIELEGATSVSDSGLGRKGQSLRLNENSFSTIGIHFEGNYLHIGLVNLANGLLDQKAFPFKEAQLAGGSFDHISSLMIETIHQFRALHPETTVLGVGLGLPGVIDCEGKRIMRRNRGFYVDFNDIFPAFHDLRDLPVYIENDMNAASLGEMILRKEQQFSNLLYLSLGTGFGGGIMINNEIWHGTEYFAGDVGSMLINFSYSQSEDKLESWRIENHINIKAILRLFEVDIRKGDNPDPETIRLISQHICKFLIPVIYNLNYVLDLTNFVLAGLVTDFLGAELFTQVEAGLHYLREHDQLGLNTQIMPTISKNSGIVGAAAVALKQCLPELLNEMA